MKTILSYLLLIALIGCQDRNIKGTITGYETDSLFLYKAKNESMYDITLLKSIPVTDGKFTINTDTLKTGLYCISLQNTGRGEYPEDYAFLFMEPLPMVITISKGDNEKMNILASGSDIEDKYAAFTQYRIRERNYLIGDSLDNLFLKARDKKNTDEMKRFKEMSIPYHNKAREKLKELVDRQIEKYKGTYFAFYLYSVYRFPSESLNTSDEIAQVRKYINTFDEASKQSSYYREMTDMLDRYEKCAIGSEAPEISGLDNEGNTIKLSNFRGKYVLVDFWSSGCTWCRLETPNMLKTYKDFKDKGFTILGVSFDYNESDWLKAIKEDKSYWNQILLSKDSKTETSRRYCVSGIPLILLVDPDGIIIAKDLRGNDIYNTVKENIK